MTLESNNPNPSPSFERHSIALVLCC